MNNKDLVSQDQDLKIKKNTNYDEFKRLLYFNYTSLLLRVNDINLNIYFHFSLQKWSHYLSIH